MIIAFTGAKGSGKDTAGTLLMSLLTNSQIIAFADPIKKVIQHLFGLDDRTFHEYDTFKRSMLTFNLEGDHQVMISSRHIVREVGMLMRSYDDTQFTRYVSDTIQNNMDQHWIVTDLRFENEYSVLKELGAVVVKVKRKGYDYDGHITETEFDDSLVDYVIDNDSDLNSLKRKLEDMVKKLEEQL